MNRNNSKNNSTETYAIPADVMVEIAQIILQADLPHEIIAVKENKRQVILEISHQPELKFHQKAIENIIDVLKQYKEICLEDSENVNWREG